MREPIKVLLRHPVLITLSRPTGGAMGPILEFVVLEGVMERLFLWSLRRQFTEDMKLEQLRIYQMLLSQARQPLLHHKPLLRPLMMLLASCAGTGTGRWWARPLGQSERCSAVHHVSLQTAAAPWRPSWSCC